MRTHRMQNNVSRTNFRCPWSCSGGFPFWRGGPLYVAINRWSLTIRKRSSAVGSAATLFPFPLKQRMFQPAVKVVDSLMGPSHAPLLTIIFFCISYFWVAFLFMPLVLPFNSFRRISWRESQITANDAPPPDSLNS